MLELVELTRRFGAKTAVDRVNLRISAGEFVGVIGPSGAGKSTLLRLINRLTEPTAGNVLFEGEDVTALRGARLRAWRARCAMIFQQFNLSGRLDVLTNVLVGRLAHRPVLPSLVKSFTVAERAAAYLTLERLGLAEAALQRAETLSGGQQQRVAIARALMQEPRILLADEPVASLDPRNAEIVMDALRDIHARGLTVLCNLHTLEVARRYCTRLVGLKDGRIAFDGPPQALDDAAAAALYGTDKARPA